MKKTVIYSTIIFGALACGAGKNAVTESVAPIPERTSTNNQTQIEQVETTDEKFHEMPMIGLPVNLKGGAVFVCDGTHYWVDGLDYWEDKFLEKPIKIWGDIVIRYDAPVFMDTSKLVSQGIPVYSEEEMKAKSKRYWIINHKYELVRP